MANGYPTISNTSSATIKSEIVTKVWNIVSGASQWGVYKNGDNRLDFAQNAIRVIMDTKIGSTTVGQMVGGTAGMGSLAVTVDSVVGLDVRKQSQVSDFRIEDGGFNSYNKVQVPDTYTIEMTRCGSVAERKVFADWLANAVGSTEIFDVITPESVYKQVTLEAYSISRRAESGGASMIHAVCNFRAVRSPKTVETSKAKTDNAISGNDCPSTPPIRVSGMETTTKGGTNSIWATLEGLMK